MRVDGMNENTDDSFMYRNNRYSRDDNRYSRGSSSPEWMQNPRPVATQFRADTMPRAVAPRRQETPVDPFSPSFKSMMSILKGKTPVSRVTASSHSSAVTSSSNMAAGSTSLTEGSVIEHQRFGIGTVLKIEGTGENTKATVEFRNTGTKQLLLKFAKYKIVR